jgi:hypothetical protein
MASGLELKLRDANRNVESLEGRREVLAREHQASVEDRRKLLLSGTDDSKLLSKADSRVSAVEDSLEGVDDALVLARSRVRELEAELVEQVARAEREAKSKQMLATVEPLRQSFATFEAATAKLIDALNALPVPEARVLAELLVEAMNPDMLGWAHQIPRFIALTEQAAHAALELPPAPVESAPSPAPKAATPPYKPERDRYGNLVRPMYHNPPTTLGLRGAS